MAHTFVWLGLGASMQGLLRDERSAKVFNTIMALVLAASVVMIFWQGRQTRKAQPDGWAFQA